MMLDTPAHKIIQKDLVPILICEDVQASIEFYTTVLGFSVTGREDELGKTGWASLNQGKVQIMLASPTYLPEPIKVDGYYPQALFYFYPENVENLHRALKEQGHKVGELAERTYGMKEFQMIDPSGHVLVFGEDVEE